MDIDHGKVSVIVPVYNGEKTIIRCFDSVRYQSYPIVEIIVVDDASVDSTAYIIEAYKASTGFDITFIRLEQNVGVAQARNIALRQARGEYISFLDCDDEWLPEKLSQQIKAMKESGLWCSHSSYMRVNEDGEKVGICCAKPYVTYRDMLKNNRIGNLTGVYNRSLLGLFFQESIGQEDYLMWLMITKKCPSVGCIEILAQYYVRRNSLSSDKVKCAVWHFNILRRELKLPLIKAVYYFFYYAVDSLLSRLGVRGL
jgi:teichuronic acid biosynthesis glycosyltransferase TuaG